MVSKQFFENLLAFSGNRILGGPPPISAKILETWNLVYDTPQGPWGPPGGFPACEKYPPPLFLQKTHPPQNCKCRPFLQKFGFFETIGRTKFFSYSI